MYNVHLFGEGTDTFSNIFNKYNYNYFYNIIYIIAIIFSALATVEIVIGIIDIAFALMAIPNMIAILYLGKHITKEMKERSWI